MEDISELLEAIERSATLQHALTQRVLDDHLAASERIIAGAAAQTVIAGARQMVTGSDPTE